MKRLNIGFTFTSWKYDSLFKIIKKEIPGRFIMPTFILVMLTSRSVQRDE
jgi:uncharacterized membrane protein